MIKSTLSILKKDFQLEWKSRFGINSVIAFVFSSLLLIIFSTKAQQMTPTAKSGLLWVVIIFAGLSSLSRIFVLETERQTFDYLRLYAMATPVFLGKFIYNTIFTIIISVITAITYVFLTDISVASYTIVSLSILLGSVGLSAVSTLLASIVAQADQKGATFSIIAMPLMIPLILMTIRLSRNGFILGDWNLIASDLVGLFAFCGVMITISILLFDFIWND